jgi:preprotein translocase subunit SecA
MVRGDKEDYVFKTKQEKYQAVVHDIIERYQKGQPVLVGTVSVEVSELLSRLLERQGMPHNVLNAKQHEREAAVILDAGRHSAVTIATNMAGRGVDIKLDPEALAAGGLYVLGTERHESRRIDNQLRGRSGRQGDPGESRFYLSAEDDLIRLFAGDRMFRVLDRLGPAEGEPIEAKMLSNVVERSQKKVEELNFLRRKNVLKYDEVMNEQRRVIYDQRNRILNGEDFGEQVREMLEDVVASAVREGIAGEQFQEEWDVDSLLVALRAYYDCRLKKRQIEEAADALEVEEAAVSDALAVYDEREQLIGEKQMRDVERAVMLEVIDSRWKDHLLDMDYLQEGIHLRALGQRDPLVEYKSEGYDLFQDMMDGVKRQVVSAILKNRPEDLAFFTAVTLEQPVQAFNYSSGDDLAYQTSFNDVASAYVGDGGGAPGVPGVTGGPVGAMAAPAGAQRFQEAQQAGGASVQQRVVERKIGRNDPCWCGSGKKFKKCHGA